jgi:hypothetical protein
VGHGNGRDVSGLLPAAGDGGAEERVDHLHVGDRISQSRVERLARENGFAEGVGLFAVLVDRRDGDLLAPAAGKIAAVVEDQPARLIGRRVGGMGISSVRACRAP